MLGKKKVIKIAILIALLVAIGLALYFIFRNDNDSNELVLYGNVDVREVDIGFRVPGQVVDLHFQEGDCVPAGALMATLDKTPYDSEVLRAKAEVEAIEAELVNAGILLERRKQLICVGGVSQENLDDATMRFEELTASLGAAKASLTIARERFSYTEAYAPTDGILLTRIKEPGSVVLESEPVYTLSILDPVWIRAYIDGPQLGLVRFGMEVTITTDTPGGKAYKGRIGFISPVAEFTPKTVQSAKLRTDLVYRLRIYVDEPDGLLKQGMPVTATISLQGGSDEPCRN